MKPWGAGWISLLATAVRMDKRVATLAAVGVAAGCEVCGRGGPRFLGAATPSTQAGVMQGLGCHAAMPPETAKASCHHAASWLADVSEHAGVAGNAT